MVELDADEPDVVEPDCEDSEDGLDGCVEDDEPIFASALDDEDARVSVLLVAGWLLVVEVCAWTLSAAAKRADVPHAIHFPEVFIISLVSLRRSLRARCAFCQAGLLHEDSGEAVAFDFRSIFRKTTEPERPPSANGISLPRHRFSPDSAKAKAQLSAAGAA